MKWFWIMMMVITTSVAYGQKEKDSVMCLSKPEVLILANKLQTLQDSSNHKSLVIEKQNRLITTYGELKLVNEERIKNQKETIDLVNKQNEELKKQVELLRPKWYDDNRLWFGAGVLTTVVVFIAAR